MTEDLSPVTLNEMKDLCNELMKVREKVGAKELELKELTTEEDRLEKTILNHLKENGLPNFKGDFGSVSVVLRKSVQQPEDMQSKMKFFEYLKEQNLLWEMVGVNSRTLSSWAGKEIEAKEKEGVIGWAPPGLKPPIDIFTLSVRKK